VPSLGQAEVGNFGRNPPKCALWALCERTGPPLAERGDSDIWEPMDGGLTAREEPSVGRVPGNRADQPAEAAAGPGELVVMNRDHFNAFIAQPRAGLVPFGPDHHAR
jgi:hypothetical protein